MARADTLAAVEARIVKLEATLATWAADGVAGIRSMLTRIRRLEEARAPVVRAWGSFDAFAAWADEQTRAGALDCVVYAFAARSLVTANLNRREEELASVAAIPSAMSRLEVERQRELGDGLTRRHLAVEEYRQRYFAAQFACVLRVGPTLRAALERIGRRGG